MNSSTDQSSPQLRIHCEAAAKLNFACHQNSYAVLRGLRIENLDEEQAHSNLTVTIEADPSFLKPKSWQIDRIDPHGIVPIRFKDLDLNGQFLLDLSESVRGSLKVRVECGEKVLTEHSQPIELLSANEWGGAGYMPELLAAFCMPNDPIVDRILHDSGKILRRAGKPDSIDGYESRSRQRVWEIAGAIYAAVANLRISYAMPPASFESDGQKIRLPSQILPGRVATCLDIALLLAAAFEQAGLNPLIALLKGHALIGVWLQPEKLASVTNDEAEVLRKRCQLKELVLIEPTLATSHPAPPFSRAMKAAIDNLAAEHDEEFVTAVDIGRARAHRISPLGLRREGSGAAIGTEEPVEVELALEDAPALPDFDQEVEAEKPEKPQGRVERWQRKLLDLSARNPLLSHRATKSSMSIFCPDPGLLEDKLAGAAKISIRPVPQAATQEQDRELHRQRTGEHIDEAYAHDALEQRQVLVDLPKAELDKRLVGIYRKAQTSLQEGGANTLYLALGFLLWKRGEKDDRRFRAPLILMPVALQRQSVRSGVKMLAYDDEPRFNTTLLEMLRKDFGIDIQGLGRRTARGRERRGRDRGVEQGAPRRAGLRGLRGGGGRRARPLLLRQIPHVEGPCRPHGQPAQEPGSPPPDRHSARSLRLGHRVRGSRRNRPEIQARRLPHALAGGFLANGRGGQCGPGQGLHHHRPARHGEEPDHQQPRAHLLGKGKTVLFVSEKTAALNVVSRRLDEIGLGRFCLELQSNKARKVDILNSSKRRGTSGSPAQRRTGSGRPSGWKRCATV